MKWIWIEEATGVVLKFLEDMLVGCRASGMDGTLGSTLVRSSNSGMARSREDGVEDEGQGPEGEEGGPGPP